MKKEQLFEAIGGTDDDLLALSEKPVRKKYTWVKYAAAAACLILVLAVALPIGISELDYRRNGITLSDDSYQVRAKYTERSPGVQTASSLINLTEEELFTHFDTAIFKGSVAEIENIELSFNGEKAYRAIARIRVETVYRGPCQEGDEVSVLLPCAIDTDTKVTDTEVVSAMRVGMQGIFMPMIYEETSYWEQNGARLALKDLAPYGLPDGERYAFLETGNDLVFARWAYESISDAATLEDIETYILEMIAK